LGSLSSSSWDVIVDVIVAVHVSDTLIVIATLIVIRS
jgi:hypothetical protein